MSFALSGCVTEVARHMAQLTGVTVGDDVRPVSGQYVAELSRVTPRAVLLELRSVHGARFVPSEADWREVGQNGEDKGVLYKLTAKPPHSATHYFTIEGGTVRRITRAT